MSGKVQRERMEAGESINLEPNMIALESNDPLPQVGAPVLQRILRDQGLTSELLQVLTPAIMSSSRRGQRAGKILCEALSSVFSINSRLPDSRKAIAFVGATGVGKTTTIAKIAARMRLAFDINIGLISADCYRVGAGFHLQSYASLIKLPFVALDPRFSISAQLSAALEEFSTLDLVLIDTAGFNPRNSGQLKQLQSDLSAFPDVERILVLPAPSNTRDLCCTVKEFDRVGYDRVVISKIDETGFMGPALNALHRSRKSLAFLTTGQRVPEDVEPASFKRLAWMLKRTLH